MVQIEQEKMTKLLQTRKMVQIEQEKMVVCLYEVTVDHWKGGVTVMFVEFLEMLFYCAVGTKLTTEGENLCDIIYNCDWYIYDLRSQKLLRILQRKCTACTPLLWRPYNWSNSQGIFWSNEIFYKQRTFFMRELYVVQIVRFFIESEIFFHFN
ncbi:hypothetical protein Bhyg_00715 [Pseudolycoriella hygida]|uniref:Uncharacterized protein n=1 Tax=Pseudolycoriella hygida TaxID=35572 RepID=A0A9Q0N8D3_9DIPT|nr:hypothetical protein Bhyg_00715 [Pseudolycoriella hygida]